MSDQIRVEIDQELEDLVPTYLSNLDKNMDKIEAAIKTAQFEDARVLGHNMKGSGGGYGFDQVSAFGKEIEEAAKEGDSARIESALTSLRDYLGRIDIVYV